MSQLTTTRAPTVKVEKLQRDGTVAILVSPGYGAGWSTWAGDEHKEFLIFGHGLVEMALRSATSEEVEDYLKEALPGEGIYMGGWHDIKVVWLPEGTPFRIEEHDGNEWITIPEDLKFTA